MAAKRGAKRAASGGASKKRGRASKKQKEEEPQQQEEDSKEKEEDSEQQADESTNSDQKEAQHDDSSKQSTDESKADQPAEAEGKAADEGKGKGKEKDGQEAEVLEKGHLFFFYRPKVDAKEVKGTDDVQKFYILISPDGAEGRPAKEEEVEGKRGAEREGGKEGSEGGKKHRLLVVSSKMLPPPGRARNPWSFVDAVGSLEEVEHKLERYSYDTKTRGHREIEPARLCGEARYSLIKDTHGNNVQTHLVYDLEVPEQPSEVQQAFNIAKEGQFLLNVKNPDFNCQFMVAHISPLCWLFAFHTSSIGELTHSITGGYHFALQRRPDRSDHTQASNQKQKSASKQHRTLTSAQIPEHLMQHFAGKRQAEVRYAPVMSTEFLDLPHAELVMIGVKKGVRDESGEFQKLVDELEEEVDEEGPKEADKVLHDELKMDEKEHPAAVEEFNDCCVYEHGWM